MKLSSITFFFLVGISMVLSSSTKGANETDINTLETVDFGEVESDNKSVEAQRKRDSGYTYKKPIRFNRPRFPSGYRGRFSKHSNQLNRPFNQYGPPSTSQEQNNLNQQRPHNQYRQPNQTPSDNLQNQGIPNPIRNYEFADPSPIASQNNEPFRIGTANYLPPKNQNLPTYSAPNAFSNSQQESTQSHQNQQINSQNFVQQDFQDQRISDAAFFLTQNAQTLSQLYGAPAPNQEYAPNNEYLSQTSNHQQNFQNNRNSQTENIQGSQGSQGFPGPLPSYASGILNSQQTLENIQSLEKDRLISQLRQALVNQAPFQNSESLGRNPQTPDNIQQQAGSGPTNPGGPQLVSPSVFGGEQTAFGHVPFLSGSAISPPGFGLGYGLSTSGQVPTTPATIPQPQGPIGGASSSSGSVAPGSFAPGSVAPGSVAPGPVAPGSAAPGSFSSSFSPGFPQYSTYIPTLIPGTNFVANVPAFGSGFLSPSSVNIPNHPASSSPTQFGIPIPNFSGQKPVSGTPTLTISPASPSSPGIQILGPGHPLSDPVKPVHPVSTPVHPVSTPVHPVSTPVHPVSTPVHPVSTPVYPVNSPGQTVLNPVHPVHPVHTVHPVHPVHPIANPSHPVATPVLPIRPVTAPAYPVVTPVHPTYGVQPSFVNSLFIKPLKPVFPVYYYPNVPFQLQKPASTTQPWNYAPTFQQNKSIWK